jgi:hypothetical protein
LLNLHCSLRTMLIASCPLSKVFIERFGARLAVSLPTLHNVPMYERAPARMIIV